MKKTLNYVLLLAIVLTGFACTKKSDSAANITPPASNKSSPPDVGSNPVPKPTIEDAKAREALPEFQIIPAAKTEELSPTSTVVETVKEEWTRSLGNAAANRYSELTQINRANVGQLKQAWVYRSGDSEKGAGTEYFVRNVQVNPVAVGGLIFTPTIDGFFVAIDAATGKEKWRFNPSSKKEIARRGLIWWNGEKHEIPPRIYFPDLDKLVALDAATGTRVKEFGTNGEVPIEVARVAPLILNRTIVSVSLRGEAKVQAFDAYTGEKKWKTHLIEEMPAVQPNGLPTEYYPGSSWAGIAGDEERGIVFLTTGNPAPQNFGGKRLGPNKYSDAIVAIDVKTGKILWSFQELEHDLWDLDLAAPPLLTKTMRDGKSYDVVVALSKMGNTIILDRVTGQPLFDFRKQRVPTSKVPFEVTAPYQPRPEIPEPLTALEFTPENVTSISKESRADAMRILKGSIHGFMKPPEIGKKLVVNSLNGGVSWGGGVSDNRGMVFVPTANMPWVVHLIHQSYDEKSFANAPGAATYKQCASCHGANREGMYENWGTGRFMPRLTGLSLYQSEGQFVSAYLSRDEHKRISKDKLKEIYGYFEHVDQALVKAHGRVPLEGYQTPFKDPDGLPASKPPWGLLNAMDLTTGKIRWRVPLGYYPKLGPKSKTGSIAYGGPSMTASGLIFMSGTPDRMIRAYDSENGKELWKAQLPFAGSAAPATYMLNGKQYVVIVATGLGFRKEYGPIGDAVVAFALP